MVETAYQQENLYKRIKRRHGDYVSRRQLYDAQRDVICELLRPDLVQGQVGQQTEGAFEGSAIVEGTGPYAALVWQRGFQYNMISRRMPWFRDLLREPPKWMGVTFKGNDDVNQYCQDLTDHLYSVYARSNYYDVMPQFVLDAGTVGSPAMLFEDDLVNDRLVCKVPHYAAVWLDKDLFGVDSSIHVKWEWSALDAEDFFGYEQLPQAVQQQLRNGDHYARTEYLQVIYPAGDAIYRRLSKDNSVPQTHPWLEHFICLAASGANEEKLLKPLHKGPGYFTRPFATWHYHRNWHEVYGRSMGWWAVHDLRGHNAMWEALFGEAELSLQPPSWALAGMRGRLDFRPRGGNWAETLDEYQNPPQFLERKTRYDVAIDFADRLKDAIGRHFHLALFLAVNQAIVNKRQPETAFALMRAEAENAGQLAPQVESYENQMLGHTHDIIIDRERLAEPAQPWGRLPEPPLIAQEYSEGEVEPKFIGNLSLAQVRDRQQMNVYRNIAFAEPIFGIAPETIQKVKWPQVLENLLEAGDFPQAHIVPEDEYDRIAEALQQRVLQAELAEAAPKVTQAAKNLQGATDKKSPLAMLTGGGR